MARGRFNKLLEFIGLVDDEPESAYGQPMGAQVYTPPQQRRPSDNARPVRPQGGYASGGYQQGAYAQGQYTPGGYASAGAAPNAREYDRYAGRGAEPRPSYRSASAPDYRANRVDQEPARPEPRQARPEYAARAAQPYRASAAAAPAPAYRSDPIRDEFDRLDQPQSHQNVITMHNDSRHQTVIYYLHTLEECRDVITDLIDGKTVLLNLEEMDEKSIQRGIDTLCGAAFALNATLRKASDKTYLIAPTNVEVAMTNEAERRF
jgi:cell division inhibitor SepF